MKNKQHTARSVPGEHLVRESVFTCPKATGNAEWYLKRVGLGTTNQYSNVMLNITREWGLLGFGTYVLFLSVLRVFGSICCTFYSQADDVCQVYVFSSFHPVLALAQMCKPAEQNNEHTKWRKSTVNAHTENICATSIFIMRRAILKKVTEQCNSSLMNSLYFFFSPNTQMR